MGESLASDGGWSTAYVDANLKIDNTQIDRTGAIDMTGSLVKTDSNDFGVHVRGSDTRTKRELEKYATAQTRDSTVPGVEKSPLLIGRQAVVL